MKTLLSLLLVASSAIAAPPPAKEILEAVRLHTSQQEFELHGELRENGRVVPFRLTQTGPVVRYSFSNPDEALQLRMGDNDSRLEEVTREGVEKISAAQFDHKVRGTAVTYEDLSLKFLYWPDARVTGENSISLRNCWKLELKAPSRQSQYSNVWLWVDKSGGALMKLEGYDWNGKLAKRFTVVSGQKIEDRWYLKEMRIESFDPATGKAQTRTNLVINKQ